MEGLIFGILRHFEWIIKYIIKTRLNRVLSSQWLNRVSRGNALSAELFRIYAHFQIVVVSLQYGF